MPETTRAGQYAGCFRDPIGSTGAKGADGVVRPEPPSAVQWQQFGSQPQKPGKTETVQYDSHLQVCSPMHSGDGGSQRGCDRQYAGCVKPPNLLDGAATGAGALRGALVVSLVSPAAGTFAAPSQRQQLGSQPQSAGATDSLQYLWHKQVFPVWQ